MSDERVAPEVIEAACKAQMANPTEWDLMGDDFQAEVRRKTEAAIRAADEARKLKEERLEGFAPLGLDAVRLVSDWRPVEREDA